MGPFHFAGDPFLFHVGGLGVRWYSVLFVAGLALAAGRLVLLFRARNLPREHALYLAWCVPLVMLVCAHLVHLVFYEPRSFVEKPMRILEIGKGLASHGGALGTVLGTVWVAKRRGASPHAYLDLIVVASVWLFPWVRLGNFMNSEILGRVTDVPWGVVFERVDAEHARHPVQLYEALASLPLIAFAERLSRRWQGHARPGAVFYTVLVAYFGYRFLLEFFKESQGVDAGWALNMGHWLSIGPFLGCAWMAWRLRPEGPRPVTPR